MVIIQTKSGSNAFHGGVFEFIRNNDLNAANFFSHQVDPLKRNQFGGFIGGPIRKDKLFFFVNYQATRTSSASTSNTTYTPTSAMLHGDFSAVNVTLPAPFVHNVMPAATWAQLVTNPGVQVMPLTSWRRRAPAWTRSGDRTGDLYRPVAEDIVQRGHSAHRLHHQRQAASVCSQLHAVLQRT